MKHSKKISVVAIALLGMALFMAGCSTDLSPEPFDANVRLTAGQVKMTVQTGKTTQQEVFTSLGAPNVVAIQSGEGEIWTYDQMKVRRTSQGYKAGAYFGTLFAFSEMSRTNVGDGGGIAGADIGGNVDTLTTSVHTATLIVNFDNTGKVASYKMLVTSF